MFKKTFSVEVDFEVYRELFSLRETEDVTFNDVLRKLLKLPSVDRSLPNVEEKNQKTSHIGGVEFPDGTTLRREYKKVVYTAEIRSGAIVINGKRFDSPSGAAMEITLGNVNGWRFWECQLPGQDEWILLDRYRKDVSS